MGILRGMVSILRAFVSSALLLLTLVIPRTARAQAAPVAGCGRVAILLAGYNTSSTDVAGTFRDVVAAGMAGIDYAEPPIQFSYRYPSAYTAAATYNALPTQGVGALHETIAAQLLRCPDDQIDLIGHSLGGAIIVRYLAQYGATPEGLHVRHAVTLDSPVNGTSHARLVAAAALLGQPQLAGSPTGLFLVRESRDSATRAANATLVRRLAPHTVVRTLESADDWIVPSRDAEIAGASLEFHLGRNYAACTRGFYSLPSCLGHDRILHDSRALSAIHSILASP